MKGGTSPCKRKPVAAAGSIIAVGTEAGIIHAGDTYRRAEGILTKKKPQLREQPGSQVTKNKYTPSLYMGRMENARMGFLNNIDEMKAFVNDMPVMIRFDKEGASNEGASIMMAGSEIGLCAGLAFLIVHFLNHVDLHERKHMLETIYEACIEHVEED